MNNNIIQLSGYRPYTRILQSLRRLKFPWRKFHFKPGRGWFVGNIEVGKSLGECLDNLRFLEKKAEAKK